MYSVIVPTNNGARTIRATIEALLGQAVDVHYEIIVVDNKSTDATRDIVQSYPGVRYIFEQEQGVSAARNAGIAASHGEVAAFTDDDCIPEPGWLSGLQQAYQLHPDAWCVGGKILLDPSANPVLLSGDCDMRGLLAHVDEGDGIELLSFPRIAPSANLAVRREIFSRIGMFNRDLDCSGLMLEDVEFCRRVHRAGGVIYYTGRAVVNHIIRAGRLTKRYLRTLSLRCGRKEVHPMLRAKLSAGEAVRETLALGKDTLQMILRIPSPGAFPYELAARKHLGALWYGCVQYPHGV